MDWILYATILILYRQTWSVFAWWGCHVSGRSKQCFDFVAYNFDRLSLVVHCGYVWLVLCVRFHINSTECVYAGGLKLGNIFSSHINLVYYGLWSIGQHCFYISIHIQFYRFHIMGVPHIHKLIQIISFNQQIRALRMTQNDIEVNHRQREPSRSMWRHRVNTQN